MLKLEQKTRSEKVATIDDFIKKENPFDVKGTFHDGKVYLKIKKKR